MMNKLLVSAALGAILVTGFALAEEGETTVKMNELPAVVQKTVKSVSQGATIKGLAKEVEDGKTYYEAEMKVNGRTKDVLIDSAGTVVEVEQEVPMEELPAAVRATIEKQSAGGQIKNVESIVEHGQLKAYEAHIKKSGKTIEIKVKPDGTVME